MTEAVIVATARSPIGRAYKGSLIGIRPDDLTAQMVQRALEKVPVLDPATIDDMLIGTALPGGEQGFNIARVVSVLLGLDGVPGTTVNRYCASSVQTTRMAVHAIRSGEAEVCVSGGVDMMSRLAPGVPDSPESRNPLFVEQGRMQDSLVEWKDPRETGNLPDIYMDMGTTAENVATLMGISRAEMDSYALRSQMNAKAAAEAGFWETDVTPVKLPDGAIVAADDGPRPTTTLEGLAGLTPVFREDGRITAGNACGLNDGAAALVLMSDAKAKELGLTPLARVVSTAVSGLSPEIMGLGPVEAVRRALSLAKMSVQSIDQFEINEAFAAQVIPSARQLEIPLEKLNVNGGAIALGHPFGMTGARITTTLINSLQHRDEQLGVVSMCIAGGMGMAMVVERLS
ncbi:acetyl-CoA C-acetyltransferase [Leucobacter sp. Z1108]|uniref:acetyl-CoA C-acetyltransferase n=1 Tax=Leucobacter sp. Z1108 TaxID=3439066 RepID=UPI003F3AD82E